MPASPEGGAADLPRLLDGLIAAQGEVVTFRAQLVALGEVLGRDPDDPAVAEALAQLTARVTAWLTSQEAYAARLCAHLVEEQRGQTGAN